MIEKNFKRVGIDQIIYDNYVICPICKQKLEAISGSHVSYKHGYSSLKEFKKDFGIPFKQPLVSKTTRRKMQEHGRRRAKWFRKEVMPIGMDLAKQKNLVPKESREHVSRLRKGRPQVWITELTEEMKKKGWIDIHDTAKEIGFSYNYMRKCATDKRLKTKMVKGIRFTKMEWVEECRQLLQENREKYRPDLIKAQRIQKAN